VGELRVVPVMRPGRVNIVNVLPVMRACPRGVFAPCL
jgi:hypothetical protein